MTRIRALLRREERVCHQLVGFGRAVEGQKDERLLKRVLTGDEDRGGINKAGGRSERVGSLGVRPLSDFLRSNPNEIVTATNIIKNRNHETAPLQGDPSEFRAQRVANQPSQPKVEHSEWLKRRVSPRSGTASRRKDEPGKSRAQRLAN